MSAITLHAVDTVHCTATWGNLFVVVWHAAPTVESVRGFGRVLRPLLDANPGGIGFLIIMRTEHPMPTPEVRAAAAEHFKAMGPRCKFQGVVYERPGVVVNLLRATLRAFAMVSASQRVFLVTSIAEAVDQAAPMLRADRAELTSAIEEIITRSEQRLSASPAR